MFWYNLNQCSCLILYNMPQLAWLLVFLCIVIQFWKCWLLSLLRCIEGVAGLHSTDEGRQRLQFCSGYKVLLLNHTYCILTSYWSYTEFWHWPVFFFLEHIYPWCTSFSTLMALPAFIRQMKARRAPEHRWDWVCGNSVFTGNIAEIKVGKCLYHPKSIPSFLCVFLFCVCNEPNAS